LGLTKSAILLAHLLYIDAIVHRMNHSLAPNFIAHSFLLGLVSIAKTLLQPLARAPCRIESPTHPIPNTATVEFSASQRERRATSRHARVERSESKIGQKEEKEEEEEEEETTRHTINPRSLCQSSITSCNSTS
jgi:hypothetical protein